MYSINKREKQIILERFPKAEIVTSKHKAFLVASDVDETARLLLTLRGIQPPSTRRERAAAARSGNGYGYDRQRRPYQRKP